MTHKQGKIWQSKDGFYKAYQYQDNTRKLIKRKTLPDLQKALQQPNYTPTLTQAFNSWLTYKQNLRPQSILRYQSDFQRFFQTSNLADRKINTITTKDLDTLTFHIIKDIKPSKKAFSNYHTILRGIFKYAKYSGYTNLSISTYLSDTLLTTQLIPSSLKNTNGILKQHELHILIDYLYNHKDIYNLAILLDLYTGLRVGELSSLKWSDVHDTHITIKRTECKLPLPSNKTTLTIQEFPKTSSGLRNILITPTCQDILNTIRTLTYGKEYIFTSKKGIRIRSNTLNKRLTNILNKLNLPHYSFHTLRKTYATALIDSNCDKSLIQSQLGHSTIETTLKYYYLPNKETNSYISQLHQALTYYH